MFYFSISLNISCLYYKLFFNNNDFVFSGHNQVSIQHYRQGCWDILSKLLTLQLDYLGILSLKHYVKELALYHAIQHSPHHCTRSVLPLVILSDCYQSLNIAFNIFNFDFHWCQKYSPACYKYSKRIFYSPTNPQQMMAEYFLFLGQGPRIRA